MHFLLVVSLINLAAAFPLEEDLLEGSAVATTTLGRSATASVSLEGSGLIGKDLEASGSSDASLEGSGAFETGIVLAAEIALAAIEDDLIQGRSASGSSETPAVSIMSEITRQTFENDDGNFSYSYSSSDGTSVETFGEQRIIRDGVGTVMRGSYSYVAPGGEKVTITWVADENGFRAFGDAIPTPPTYVEDLQKRTADAQEGTAVDDDPTAAEENSGNDAGSHINNGDSVTDGSHTNDPDVASTPEDTSAADEDAVALVEKPFASDEGEVVVLEDLVDYDDETALDEIRISTNDGDGDQFSVAVVDGLVDFDAESDAAETAAAAGEAHSGAEESTSLAVVQSSAEKKQSVTAETALGALEILARFS